MPTALHGPELPLPERRRLPRRRGASGARGLAALWLTMGCAAVHGQPAAAPAAEAVDPTLAERQVLVTVRLKEPWRLPSAGSSGAAAAPAYRASARTRRLVADLARAYDLREISSWPIRPLGVHCVVFEVPAASATDEIVGRLAGDPRVESAQPMNLFETRTSRYNDPYVDLQHGVGAMQVEEAHRWALGNGVEIAVIDTGIDLAHPELADRIRLARDFVDDDHRELSADPHGTAVAGVIVSTVDNGIGIIGVAPGAWILALRACWQEARQGASGVCNSFTLAKALTFAIERRPHILNLSLAGPADPLLERLLRVAVASGIVVVAAVGDLPDQSFPGTVDGVIGVGAADGGGVVTRDGLTDLLAPGTDIVTTSPAGGFDFLSGHSLAAAHVTGVAALVLERQPGLDAARLHALLRDTSTAGDPPAVALVNACAAVSRLVAGAGCTNGR